MLGMVFEVGIEAIAPVRPDDIKQPGELVVGESQ
jgi:hypothetical protein